MLFFKALNTDQKTCPCPPSLCSFITLITYQFSFLLFTCLACLRVSLRSPTLAPRTLLAYQHTWLSLFLNLVSLLLPSHLPPIVFVFVFSTKCFYSSPPWILSPTFHFSLPFSPSWLAYLLQPACFSACLRLFSLWPLLSLLLLGELDWRGWGRSATLLPHGQNHTQTQAISTWTDLVREQRTKILCLLYQMLALRLMPSYAIKLRCSGAVITLDSMLIDREC